MNYQNREWLYNKYWNEKLSVHEIAKLYKVSSMTIWNWMVRLDIPRRTLNKCNLREKNHFYGKHHTEKTKKENSISHTGSNHNQWKGGIKLSSEGYILVWIDPKNPFYIMKDHQNYIKEHRLIMAQHLGRCLESWEIVHHKGIKYPINSIENKQDNRLENLELVSPTEHTMLHNIIRGGDANAFSKQL